MCSAPLNRFTSSALSNAVAAALHACAQGAAVFVLSCSAWVVARRIVATLAHRPLMTLVAIARFLVCTLTVLRVVIGLATRRWCCAGRRRCRARRRGRGRAAIIRNRARRRIRLNVAVIVRAPGVEVVVRVVERNPPEPVRGVKRRKYGQEPAVAKAWPVPEAAVPAAAAVVPTAVVPAATIVATMAVIRAAAAIAAGCVVPTVANRVAATRVMRVSAAATTTAVAT